MDTALVSAFSALGGSVIGGLISGVAAVASQRVQAKATIVANEITRREDLYKDFIMAASTAYGDALLTNEPKVDKLVSLYALVSRMRVLLGRVARIRGSASCPRASSPRSDRQRQIPLTHSQRRDRPPQRMSIDIPDIKVFIDPP